MRHGACIDRYTCIVLFLLLSALPAEPWTPQSVRAAMSGLSIGTECSYPEVILDYFRYYGLDFKGISHWFGSYPSDSFVLAAHLFRPPVVRGAMLVVHGYYDHAGIMRTIIRQALDSGYAVAAIDLPGHGLSSGKRSSIRDFSRYGAAIRDFLELYETALPRPLLLTGHSTGCAAIMEYLHDNGERKADGVIWCAPLVRPVFWKLSRAGYFLIAARLSTTGRWFRNSSSDAEWKRWYRSEPLQETRFPTEWAGALYAWNKRLVTYGPFTLPVTVLQGEKDETLDWRYNCRFLKSKCENMTIRFIKKGRHHLPNEGEPARREFIELFGEAIRIR